MQAIYQTQNRALAITLATCGVSWAKDDQGREHAYVHIYDRETLLAMKDTAGTQIYKGWELEKAARHAWQTGRAGMLVFNLVRNDLCERILKAYDAHSKAIEEAESSGLPMPCEIDVQPEIAAMICCQFTKNRNVINNGWRKGRPYLAFHGGQRTEQVAGKTILIGSFKLQPL